MPKIEKIADPQYVANQYRNASNLNVRIRLHQRFSTNQYGWPRWIFDQLSLPPRCRVLELGCGPGDLWRENSSRIPAGWKVALSDSSLGMLRQATGGLNSNHPLQFCVIDAQSIPMGTESFDAVIANFMLYHVPDKPKALAEVQRILKPDGRFYAATVGERHLQEISALVSRFDPQLASWREQLSDSFTLENGAAQLAGGFADTELRRYEDSLVVTEAAPLVSYIVSGRVGLSADEQSALASFVEQELQVHGGKLHITKDVGVFVASNPYPS